jgi:hypothetical protein
MSKRQGVECSLPLQKRQVLLWKSLGPMGSVQSSRWDGTIFLMIPGTSCLATIVLSLRDKSFAHRSASQLLSAYGLKTRVEPLDPFGAKTIPNSAQLSAILPCPQIALR